MNSIVNLKDGFITFNSNIDHSLSFSKCAIGYSNYSINSHERGALVFLTNNNANTANVSMHSDIRMCIASDGNIGIGTNNPSQKLDIAGNTNISRILKIGGINQNDDEIKLQVYASSNNIIAIFKHPNDSQGIGITYDSVFALGSDTNVAQPISIKSKGNTNVVLNTNSIDRLTVLGNGNVGIGTNNANSRLHLHNTTANSDVGIRFSDFTSGAGATQGFAIGENSIQQAYLLNYGNTDMLFSTNNAERLRILANGNVGIGTTIPETALDVNGNLLIRAYGTTGSGTKGIFLRPDFVTTNQYNCSILTFDHSSSGANDGISINGYQGVSFCTGANTRQERMRISENGNVGIGTTNPAYRTHIKCVYDDISKGLHLDASDAVASAPNQYALTIYPYIVGAGQVGWKFRSQSQIGGTQTPLTFDHAGNVILGGTISGNGSLLTTINAANISSGTISSLRLPVATTSVLGGVKVDGTTITINSSTGVISGANTYVLPTATTSVLGGVKVDGTIHTIINDTLKIIEPTSYLMQDVETNVRMYPPIRNFTGASGTTIAVSGQQYGNGNYTIHYTSQQVDYYRPTTVFNEIEDRGGIWGANNYTNGVYNKTLSIVNDTLYPGDGVKIQFPVSIRLTSYILKNSYDIATAPKDFQIYGSINGTTWDILDQRANITHMDVSATFGKFAHIYEQDVNTYNYYSHYAITVNKNNGGDFIHIDEWYIYGREAIPSQYNYKKNSIIKYVAGNQNDINFRNTGSWQISDDILPATNNVLGGVKGGGNISIATDGTISAIGYKIKNINADNISTGTINSLRLPVATASDIGGVKKGNNINIVDGTISVDLLSYNGNSTINGDLIVNSNLIVHGTSTILNTDVYTTERLEITNGGSETSLTLKQTSAGNTKNILEVINSATSNVFNVSSTGNTGIGTTNPINRLHLHNTTANSDVSIRFTDTTSGAGATQGFAIGENTTQQAYLWNYGNTDMLFATNNAERLRILANGNVGIGTNSALSSLHLHKNAITQDVRIILSDNTSTSAVNRGFQIGKDASSQGFIWNYENSPLHFATNATERLRIAANGNIGIGTNADIQSKLTINGIDIGLANNINHSEAPLTITNPTATSTSVLNDPKAVLNLCRTGTSGQAYSARACFKLCRYENSFPNSRTRLDITLAHNQYDELNIMSLQSGGNVGIGTTNPVSRLHLHNTTANSDVAIRFTDSTSGSGATNGFVIGENSTQKAYLWNYGNTDMLFATNNAERMTISNAGNVGIGTISPNANLHLHGNAASQNVRISFSDNTSGIATTDGFCIGKDGLQKAYIYNCENADIDFGTSNTERMRIMANGNIGIGTNSALSSLHLHKNALAQDVRMIISDNTSTSSLIRGLHLIKGGDHIGYLWNYENTPLILGTNNAERIRIAENGNVGIGTNDPAIYKCQVNGNLGATGNITAYYSDERLKNITEYVSDVLPALDKINVFKYNCNDLAESFGYDKSKKEIGLSAQEIQKFYPEIVSIAPFDADCDKETKQIISKSGENYLTLDYERLVPVLLQAIKELNRKYTALEDKYNKIMPT
jgi:phage FluMu protein gp41